MVLLGWGLLQKSVMRWSDVLDVPTRRRGVSWWPGQCRAVMLESNDEGLRTRHLTGNAVALPMACQFHRSYVGGAKLIGSVGIA